MRRRRDGRRAGREAAVADADDADAAAARGRRRAATRRRADEPDDDDRRRRPLAARDDALAPIAEDLARPGQAGPPGRAERRARRPAPPAGQDRRRQGAAAARGPAHPVGARAPAAVDLAYAAGAAVDAPAPRRRRRPARCPARCSPSSRPSWSRRCATRLDDVARVDRRPVAGRRRDRDRAAPRCPVPRVAGPAPRSRARRRARRPPTPVASYDAAPEGARLRWVPGAGREVPRLRRQRARADGEGRATSRPGSRTRRRTPGVAACSWSTTD